MDMQDQPVLNQPSVEVPPPINYQVPPKQKEIVMKPVVIVGLCVAIIAAGVGTGYGIHAMTGKGSIVGAELTGAPGTVTADQIAVGKTYGAEDGKKFPDQSEGVIQKGGMDGEGTHHLVRPGGASQTVYLTSSVVDLDLFTGHKVLVQGETFSAQKAAWFMDVGSVKVLELNVQQAETPAAASSSAVGE